jgi:hypothetical protein
VRLSLMMNARRSLVNSIPSQQPGNEEKRKERKYHDY